MRSFLLSLLLGVSLSTQGQILVQAGAGGATSGLLHPITEIDGGWQFSTPFHGIPYQLTGGYIFNPSIDKTVYNVKLGGQIEGWTFKAGVGMVNQVYNIKIQTGFPPADISYRPATYTSSYSILLLGVERYIDRWERDRYKVYYGADLVDGNVHVKMGVRLHYLLNK